MCGLQIPNPVSNVVVTLESASIKMPTRNGNGNLTPWIAAGYSNVRNLRCNPGEDIVMCSRVNVKRVIRVSEDSNNDMVD